MTKIKKLIYILISLIIILLIIPFITVNTIKAENGMAMALLYFFVVNPIYSVILGIISAKDIKFFWFVPMALAVMFWIGSSITYVTAFPTIYSLIYFLICSASMGISYFIIKIKKQS